MSEDLELQNQIAQLAGRINRHKTSESHPAYNASSYQSYGTAEVASGGVPINTVVGTGHQAGWTPRPGLPYGAPRGRGRGARAAPHRNRTLVLNSGSSTPVGTGSHDSQGLIGHAPNETSQAGWVTKRDRHMQLINSSVYEKKTQERTEAIEATRRQKKLEHEAREKARINMHFSSLQPQTVHYSAAPSAPHQIYVEEIRFLIADGGSKLIKAPGESEGSEHAVRSAHVDVDEANLVKITPKRAQIGGVTFFRSKRGNLYRAGLVKSKRSEKISHTPVFSY